MLPLKLLQAFVVVVIVVVVATVSHTQRHAYNVSYETRKTQIRFLVPEEEAESYLSDYPPILDFPKECGRKEKSLCEKGGRGGSGLPSRHSTNRHHHHYPPSSCREHSNSSSSSSNRIYDGYKKLGESTIFQYPVLPGIIRIERGIKGFWPGTETRVFAGSGVLVTRQHVLTSSKNIEEIQKVEGYTIWVSWKAHLHDYGSFRRVVYLCRRGRVALLALERPFDLNKDLYPACLPEEPIGKNQQMMAAGWGYTGDKANEPDTWLWYPYSTTENCTKPDDDMDVCTMPVDDATSGQHGGLCLGDTGSGLFAHDSRGRLVVQGINYKFLSATNSCESAQNPAIAADLFQYRHVLHGLINACRIPLKTKARLQGSRASSNPSKQ